MFRIRVFWFLAIFATLVTCKHVRRREIDRDTHHKAIGPTVSPQEAHLYSYQVAFREWCRQNCGGTIISDRHILTAAHCLAGSSPTPMTIKAGVTYLGDQNGQIRDVFSVKTHRNFDPLMLYNDIALLTLQEPLNLTGLTVAKLPNQDEDFEGEFIEASGWGGTDGHLTYAHFTVRHNHECEHPSQMCVDPYPNMNTYSGDSGGPVVKRSGDDVILAAWVSGKSPTGQTVFGDVGHFRQWIDEAMAEGNELVYPINKMFPDLPKNSCPV